MSAQLAPAPEAPQMTLAAKIGFAAIPVVLAIGGIALWQFVIRDHVKAHDVAAASPSAPPPPIAPVPATTAPTPPAPAPAAPPAPAANPTPPPPPPAPAPTPVVAPAPAPRDMTVARTPKQPTPAPPPKQPPAKIVEDHHVAAVTPAPEPAPVPVVVAPPPPVPAPPPVPEPPAEIPQLSSSLVSSVANDHARQLAACEAGQELHGDVSVSFQIDAAGRVTKTGLSQTIKNPKIAGCLQNAVRGWQFPKPPSGSAKGVYNVNYQ